MKTQPASKTLFLSLFSLGILLASLLFQMPAMALTQASLHDPIVIGTMSSDLKATAKDAEGKLQSAAGSLTGDNEMKVKGELKQGQAAAMNAAADLKKGAKTAAKKAGDAADKAADKLN